MRRSSTRIASIGRFLGSLDDAFHRIATRVDHARLPLVGECEHRRCDLDAHRGAHAAGEIYCDRGFSTHGNSEHHPERPQRTSNDGREVLQFLGLELGAGQP